MTTTDSNGLIQYQTTDNVVPLQTTLNAISSSVSTSLNSTVRTFKVANDTERNALATTRVPSATNPLLVFNSASGKGYHEINTGSGWSRWIPDTANTSNTQYTGNILAGVANGSKTTEITNTTVSTSVSGGVYVDISGWKGIHSVACTPRNSDQKPLAVSVESVTLTQVLLRFASRDGAYYSAGLPITLTINGWK